MERIMRSLLICLAFAFVFANAYADESAIPTFGDWAKKCESSKDAEGVERQICYVFQTVSNKETGQMIMQVRVGFAPGKNEPVMIATLPLGALLPPGAAFVVEGAEPVKMPFLACGREGCTTIGQLLSKAVVDAMQKGETASVRVALLNKKVLPVPVSLKGFTRAYNAIAPK